MAKAANWSPAEIDILRSMYGRVVSKRCCDVLHGRSPMAVMIKANELGLRGNRSVTRMTHFVDQNYFDSPNVENSYWAGFIAADGEVEAKRNTIRIQLHMRDREHLEAFKSACGSSHRIVSTGPHPRNYAMLRICGVRKWRDDLLNHFKISPRKSLTLDPPVLPRRQSLAFIAGYIDGDGCVFTEQPPRGRLRIGLQITGTCAVLGWIKGVVDEVAPSKYEANVIAMGHVYSYKIVGVKARCFLSALARLPISRLDRKRMKFEQFEACA